MRRALLRGHPKQGPSHCVICWLLFQCVQPVQERGHVLPVHAHHATVRAVRIASGHARAAQPANVARVRCGIRHVREALRLHGRAARGQLGQTMHERGHILAFHRIHAAERARSVGLLPAGADARVGEPQDVLRVRSGRRDVAERLPICLWSNKPIQRHHQI